MIQGFGLPGGLMVKAKPIMPPPSLMVVTWSEQTAGSAGMSMTVTLVHVPVSVSQPAWRLGTPASAAPSVIRIMAKITRTFEILYPLCSDPSHGATTSRSRRLSHSSHMRGMESPDAGSPFCSGPCLLGGVRQLTGQEGEFGDLRRSFNARQSSALPRRWLSCTGLDQRFASLLTPWTSRWKSHDAARAGCHLWAEGSICYRTDDHCSRCLQNRRVNGMHPSFNNSRWCRT